MPLSFKEKRELQKQVKVIISELSGKLGFKEKRQKQKDLKEKLTTLGSIKKPSQAISKETYKQGQLIPTLGEINEVFDLDNNEKQYEIGGQFYHEKVIHGIFSSIKDAEKRMFSELEGYWFHNKDNRIDEEDIANPSVISKYFQDALNHIDPTNTLSKAYAEGHIEVPYVKPAKIDGNWMVSQVEDQELSELDVKANEASTSPLNEKPEPTKAQKDSGNYAKGYIKVSGLDIAIENPRGSSRSGTDEEGNEWSSEMKSHYGYFKRTDGHDGDQVDVFLGKGAELENPSVYIVDQIFPDTNAFDEHKVMIGFDSEESARQGYLENYDENWQGLGAITELSMDAFKKWVDSGATKRPFSWRPKFGLDKGGVKHREKINDQVKSIVKQIQSGKDPADLTPNEMNLLTQYSGKGGLTENSQYEYYTPSHVAGGVWDILGSYGLESGNVLDPATGSGAFSASKPKGMVITGAEIDEIGATVNQVLHPEDQIINQSFEKLVMNTEDGTFDAVVGNVPFGDARGASAHDDPEHKKEKLIERYFVMRAIDKVRSGGLVALVVPVNIVNAKGGKWSKFRSLISKKAEFLGAHKLPSNTFGKQGTSTVTDVIVMRKHSEELLAKIDDLPVEILRSSNVLWSEFLSGQYWKGEGKKFIHGKFIPKDPSKFRDSDKVINNTITNEGLRQALARRFESRIDWESVDSAEPIIKNYINGDRKRINGQEHELVEGLWIPVVLSNDTISINKTEYGADSIEELKALLFSSKGLLSLSLDQARMIYDSFPDLLSPIQTLAVKFALEQRKGLQKQAMRSIILGFEIEGMQSKLRRNDVSDDDQAEMRELVMSDYGKYGHPSKFNFNLKNSEAARFFGIHSASLTSDGELSDANQDGIEILDSDSAYDATNAKAVVEHIFLNLGRPIVTIEDYNENSDNPIESLSELSNEPDVAISPAGYLMPMNRYCSGNYGKAIDELNLAIVNETDKRLLEKYATQLEAIESKRIKTPTEDISFSLQSKWFPRKYALEFLHENGFSDVGWGYFKEGSYGYSSTEVYDIDNDYGEWTGYEDGSGIQKQVKNYLNGDTVRGRSDGEQSNREKLREIDGLFNMYMQTHLDSPELSEIYNRQFNDYIPFDYEEASLGLENISDKIVPHGYQNATIRQLSENGSGVMGLGTGLGKAQPLTAKILTPNGWVLMGSLSVGDQVIGSNGKPTKITGVFPQGKREVFDVVFNDDSKTQCCDEHLWSTRTQAERNYNGRVLSGLRKNPEEAKYSYKTRSLFEIRNSLRSKSTGSKNHSIRMVDPVEFNEKKLYINPYLMGVYIGDGSTASGGLTISLNENDNSIFDRICHLMPNDMMIGADKLDRGTRTFAIKDKGSSYGNRFITKLKGYDLFKKKSIHKSVPNDYLINSFENRLLLLQGLMDTDGYVSKSGVTTQFSSSSKKLADDVIFLVRSFGGNTTLSSKIPHYRDSNGDKVLCSRHYIVNIKLPAHINPFLLKRKRDLVRPKTKYSPIRYIKDVVSAGSVETQCISVDSEDRLYVTDDFILTHNTLSSIGLYEYNRKMGRSKRTCIVVPKSVLANWFHEQQFNLKDKSGVLFVGFTPKKDKDNNYISEAILDEEGNQSINKFTQEPMSQVVLKSDAPKEVFKKMHMIPQSNYSLVIMTHQTFERIPMRPDSKEEYADRMTLRSLLSDSQATKMVTGQTNSMKGDGGKLSYNEAKKTERYKQQFSDAGIAKKDEFPFFEDMEFDTVMVDESHYFKNAYESGNEASRIAYLSTPPASKRGMDMSMKLDHVKSNNNGRGSIMVTATPITNSPLEIYNVIQMVAPPEELERMGVYTPDDFVRLFGKIEEIDKMSITGDMKTTDALTGLKNLSGIRNLFHKYAIIKGSGDVNLSLPDMEEVFETVELSSNQMEAYETLRRQAKLAIMTKDALELHLSTNPEDEALLNENGEAPAIFSVIRNMDRVTTDMDMYLGVMTFVFNLKEQKKVEDLVKNLPQTVKRKMYDPDTSKYVDFPVELDYEIKVEGKSVILVVPDAFEKAVVDSISKSGIDISEVAHPVTPKYAKLIENLIASHENGGKQLIFTEEKTQHNKLARIIVHHLPIELAQIGIINAEEADGEKLQLIADGYNSGKQVIVIANKKAEVGVNLQKKTTDIHHMTLPWTPASIHQRNGRGVRQGNVTKTVNSHYYLGKGSFDQFRLDLINKKGSWIDSLLKTDESSMDNAEKDNMSAEEIEYLLSDNPEEAKRKMEAVKAKKAQERQRKLTQSIMVSFSQLYKHSRLINQAPERIKKEKDELAVTINDAKTKRDRLGSFSSDKTAKEKLDAVIKFSERRLETIDKDWEKYLIKSKSIVKQNSALLKSKAVSGDSPVSLEMINNPLGSVMSQRNGIITIGNTYEIGNSIFRVERIEDQKVIFETIVGNSNQMAYGVDHHGNGLFGLHSNKLPELTLIEISDHEVSKRKYLSNAISYADLLTMGRSLFDEIRDEMKLTGDFIVLDNEGYKISSYYDAGENRASIAFPDPSNKVLIEGISRSFLAANRTTDASYKYRHVMKVLLGDDWETEVLVYGNSATKKEILELAHEIFNNSVETSDFRSAMSDLGAGYYAKGQWIIQVIDSGEWDNKKDITSWIGEFQLTKKGELDNFLREEAAAAAIEADKKKKQEEEEKLQKLKDSGDFKAISPAAQSIFDELGITAKYNKESVVIKMGKRSLQLNSYEALFLHDPKGMSGELYKRKDAIKKTHKAKFTKDIIGSDLDGAWWFISKDEKPIFVANSLLEYSEIIEESNEANADAPAKYLVPDDDRLKIGDKIKDWVITGFGKSWEAKAYNFDLLEKNGFDDLESVTNVMYAYFK